MTRIPEAAIKRWTIYVCPECGDYSTDWKQGIDCNCKTLDWTPVEVMRMSDVPLLVDDEAIERGSVAIPCSLDPEDGTPVVSYGGDPDDLAELVLRAALGGEE